MEQIRRILVINRLTQYTRDAVRYGLDLAKKFDADLCLLRIVTNPVDMEAVNAPNLSLKWEEGVDHPSMREQYQQEIDRELSRIPGTHVPVKLIMTHHDGVDDVVQVVKKEKIDLIVLLAHEESRLEHLLFGGENDRLIRKLPCSILLAKHEPMPVP